MTCRLNFRVLNLLVKNTTPLSEGGLIFFGFFICFLYFKTQPPYEAGQKTVGHPSPGRGPQGRAPGWVPGAHQSRPEAQGRREKGWAKGRVQGGGARTRGAQQRERVIAVQKAGYCGAQEVGINAGQTGGTTTIFLGRRVNTSAIKPKPHRPGSRIAERGSMSEALCPGRSQIGPWKS